MMRILFRLVRQGICDLTLNPLAQVFTLAAVTLVAFLCGMFLIVLTTLNHQLGAVRGETAFQVFWKPGTDTAVIKKQWKEYEQLSGFSHVKTYTQDEALQELGTRLGREKNSLGKGFPFLAKESPLPATALLFFQPNDTDITQWVEQTTKHLESQPAVDRVVTTPLRDELGQAWRKVSRYVMWPSITLLTLMLGLVVGNTIRLALLARTHEIEILQLVGAYTWYIRLPLIVSGTIQGLVGGGLALVLLRLVHMQIREVLNFSPLFMEIQFLPLELSLALLFVPAAMGALASRLAVRG